jgi:hypothetical protein
VQIANAITLEFKAVQPLTQNVNVPYANAVQTVNVLVRNAVPQNAAVAMLAAKLMPNANAATVSVVNHANATEPPATLTNVVAAKEATI